MLACSRLNNLSGYGRQILHFAPGLVLAIVFAPSLIRAQELNPKSTSLSRVRSAIQSSLRERGVPGLAIAVSKNKHVLWEEGFGWADVQNRMQASKDTPFYLASVTKSITATAILQLQETGKLNLDNPVNDYLGASKVHSPVWNPSASTVRRILSHTGGLTTFSRWCLPGDSGCAIEEEIERYGIIVWPPGEVFDYSNLGYGILGDVVARTSGFDLESYLRKELFGPLMMRHCGSALGVEVMPGAAVQYNERTHAPSPMRISGHPGASGLRCSAHDLLIFGMFQLKDHLAVRPILSAASLDEMHRPQPNTHGQYGLGWWLRSRSGYQIVAAEGGTTDSYASLALVPSQDVAVVVIANSYSKFVSGLSERILSAVLPGYVLAAEPGAEPSSRTRAPAPPQLVGKWSGKIFSLGKDIQVSLEIEPAGIVRGQIGSQPLIEAASVSMRPSHFYAQLPGEPALVDAPRQAYWMELDLALHDKELLGAATTRPPPGEDGNQLPHWVKLSRVE